MDLVPGLQVILRHLKQAASLNGSRGILERFDLASNRWEVGFWTYLPLKCQSCMGENSLFR